MKGRDPSLYLTHVLESIDLVRGYVEGVDFRRFSESQQLQDAVTRRIEIIGEAVKYLGPQRLAADTRVPARAACSGRNASAERVTRRGGPGAWGRGRAHDREPGSRVTFGPTEEPVAPIRHPHADG